MIYIFSSKNAASLKHALKVNIKNPWAEVLPAFPKKHKYRAEDQVYLDIYGLSPAQIKKALVYLKKSSPFFWGIIDPKGVVKDPGSFFFEGACDYISQAVVKKGLDKKRFSAAFSWAAERKSTGSAAGTQKKSSEAVSKKKTLKLETGKFDGWKSIRTGTHGLFFFLFVTLSGKSSLRSLVGEAAFITQKNKLRDVLQQSFREADALLWMETEDSSLLLIPPRRANCKTAIETAYKMILNSRLISMERLDLAVPVDFTFALHLGHTVFQAPGKTGDIISEAVNFIFHLGAKKAEQGRLTISDDVPKDVIPEGLLELFNPAGIFEGIPIRHSRRFIFKHQTTRYG